MNNPFRIIWLKAGVAFFVPFFAALGGAFSPYVFDGMPAHWGIAILIIICSTMVASLSALSSFLSKTFAEHVAQQQSGLDDAQPPPITAAQMAAAPATIPVPVVQPTPVAPAEKKQ
jgi:hypothetical protein